MSLEKAEKKLTKLDKFLPNYRRALANFYFRLAITGSHYYDKIKYLKILKKIVYLEPAFKPDISIIKSNPGFYTWLIKVFGFVRGGLIYKLIKDVKNGIKS